MGVLDVQRRSQQIGRIRIGQQVKTAKGGMRPAKLDTFRFTTASKTTADAIAGLFGGTVRDWEGQYEVITDRSEIGVTVPPRDAVISQWYEKWTAGGCERRCDSQHEQISGGQCLCPRAADPSDREAVAEAALRRAELSKANPPQACKLVTRINVMIPDLPGLGVFRLDTGSFYAAGESGDKADLMEVARERNIFLPANLRIEQRKRISGGQTKKYPVPVLEILSTFRAIATGQLEAAGMAAQLPPAPGEQRRAITAGAPVTPDVTHPVPDPGASAHAAAPPVTQPDEFSVALAAITETNIARAGQQIVTLASRDVTPGQMRALKARATELRILEDQVCVQDDGHGEVWEELGSWLKGRWEKLQAAGDRRREAAA